MKADALTLAAALNSSEVDFYTIPQYQRPYTWEKDNFSVLWEDLTSAYEEYKNALANGSPREYYFLGPVVFVMNRVKKSFDIIDGQQRTTTFHIMLWYLYRKLTDETEKARILQILTFLGNKSKLLVSAKDAATFLEIRETESPITGSSKMADSANYFRDRISQLTEPNEFSEFLREYTQFIVIIADDYNKAWDLFIGLNGKGEPLNPTDLVKAYVCGQSDIGDQIGSIWEEKILPLKEDSTQFLLFLSRFKGKKFVSENALFKEFTKQFPINIREVDLTKYSDLFLLFWIKPIEEIEDELQNGFSFTMGARKNLKILRDLQRRDITTLIFQFAEAFGNESVFDESFLKLLSAYQIRMAITRKRSRERKFVTDFKDALFISKAIEGDTRPENQKLEEDKENVISKIRDFTKADAPDDETFEKFVNLADYGNYTARIILRSYEEGERGNRAISDFQLEHLMPQKGTDYWFTEAGTDDKTEYAKIVNRIGNLFVIDAVTNNQVKNRDYSTKKDFYQLHLADWSIARVTATRSEWKTSDIKVRAEQIAAWAKGFWSLS